MSVCWDSSALVKLYIDEADAEAVREWRAPAVISALAVTEVTATIWAKVRRGDLMAELARVLDAAFATDVTRGRFAVVELTKPVVDQSLHIVRRHGLRGADALQLATALLAREAEAACATVAAFDMQLRAAASAEGFTLLPAPRGRG